MSRPANEPPSARPYVSACEDYLDHGWPGPIPLPVKQKGPPPVGYTGRSGIWPSRADIAAWATGDERVGNIGLRLPDTIVGIDVDAYGSKAGRDTLAKLIEKWGPLPATWRSTSRDDGVSGIYLFRVPAGFAWPGELGPGVEIIQHVHRYVVVYPSVHPSGAIYRWFQGDGIVVVGALPRVDDIPALPDSWVQGATRGELARDVVKQSLDSVELTSWVVKHGDGEQCAAVRMTVDRYLADRFNGSSSRHDAARDATARLFSMAAEGHRGVASAVNEIGMAFRAAIETGDDARQLDQGEWQRLWTGAVRLAAVDTAADVPRDPCVVTVLDDEGEIMSGETPTAGNVDTDTREHCATETTPPPATVLDVSTISVADAERIAAQRAIEAELRVQRTRREARKLLDAEDARALFREPPSTFTLAEELALPDEEIVWAVEELLPREGNALLAAQFKAGKTTLVSDLARCLVDGLPFLGRFAVPPLDGRVALWNYEVGGAQYRRWLRDARISDVERVVVLNARGYTLPLNVPTVADWCVRWLVERDVRVWVVDPFARAFTGSDENSNTEVARWLDALDEIKSRAGVRELILTTHTGRAEQQAGAERARGATRLDDWPDVRWLLMRDEQSARYFRASGRDVEVDEMQLAFDNATRRLSIGSDMGRNQAANERDLNSVLAVVQTRPGIASRELRQALRWGDTRLDRVLAGAGDRLRMTREGQAKRYWVGVGPLVLPSENDE